MVALTDMTEIMRYFPSNVLVRRTTHIGWFGGKDKQDNIFCTCLAYLPIHVKILIG